MLNMTDIIKKENIITRPPVVVVVGHIDHGKSSLLEAIRDDFKITENESGGITQHIGAYEVIIPLENELSSRASHQAGDGSNLASEGRKITFIDTPGHEAFSAMRQRGTRLADIAILVIDACESIKAQTKEAIKFVQEAAIPMIVAINKIDKPGAIPERVKKDLSDIDILVESYGGKIPSCNISAKTKQGINELLETVALVAEVENLTADLMAPAEGIIIESLMDPQKGPIATLVLAKGVLKEGDVLGTNGTIGKVKCLYDFRGKKVEKAMPAQPVGCLGFEKPPKIGDCFKVFNSSEEAHAALSEKSIECRENIAALKDGQKLLGIVLKADVLGSIEAIEGILSAIPDDKVVLEFLKSGIGDINTSDIRLAEGGGASIYGFKVKVEETAKIFAEQRKVRIKIFDIIYDLIQEVRKGMTGVLDSETKRVNLGKFKATVLFKQGKEEQIIGGKVVEGEIMGETSVEIFREEEKIGHGKVKTVQQEKKNVGKISKGQECAFLLRSETKVAEGDVIHFYKEERQRGTL